MGAGGGEVNVVVVEDVMAGDKRAVRRAAPGRWVEVPEAPTEEAPEPTPENPYGWEVGRWEEAASRWTPAAVASRARVVAALASGDPLGGVGAALEVVALLQAEGDDFRKVVGARSLLDWALHRLETHVTVEEVGAAE